MGTLLRILFPLIGYLATATVVTLGLGAGYLWRTDRLTEDKMFRIVAMLQGVDLQQISELQRQAEEDVPLEEPSMNAVSRQQQVLDRNYEVKLLALQRGRQEYDHRLQQLKEQSERYDRLARDWQDKLQQQEDAATEQAFADVVSDLEQVKPDTAKDLLMRWIDEDRMDDVITMLGRMSENKKKKILQSFATPEELDRLHELHRLMLEDDAAQKQISQALHELQALDR